MKRHLRIALVALVIAAMSCELSTPGPATVAELMAPFVAEFGAPTGKPPSTPPVLVVSPSEQVWTWFPVLDNKTLTVTAELWKADFATNTAWRESHTIE